MVPKFENLEICVFPDISFDRSLITGKGAKGVLILIEVDQYSEELSAFLTKVFASIGIDLALDAFVVNIFDLNQISYKSIKKDLQLDQIILFDVDYHRLGLNFRLAKYQPTPCNGIQFMVADDLHSIYQERMAGGKQMSRQLWESLKQMFTNNDEV